MKLSTPGEGESDQEKMVVIPRLMVAAAARLLPPATAAVNLHPPLPPLQHPPAAHRDPPLHGVRGAEVALCLTRLASAVAAVAPTGVTAIAERASEGGGALRDQVGTRRTAAIPGKGGVTEVGPGPDLETGIEIEAG